MAKTCWFFHKWPKQAAPEISDHRTCLRCGQSQIFIAGLGGTDWSDITKADAATHIRDQESVSHP
jgi:hypothetical protein